MKVFKKFVIIFFLLLIYIFVCAISYARNTCFDISNSIFRLHIIANSDSIEDQNLKYLVRDNILEYMNSLTDASNPSSKEDIIRIAKEHLSDFEEIAKKTIYENGFNYKVSAEVGNFDFPVKTYGDISFPSGYYDALRIKIGNASGKNWWCVMFPPLCFIDVSSGIVPEESKELLESQLTEDEYKLISTSENNPNIKFKIVEVLQNFDFSGIFM